MYHPFIPLKLLPSKLLVEMEITTKQWGSFLRHPVRNNSDRQMLNKKLSYRLETGRQQRSSL